ncbi:MAG: GDP-mannose 4,6-dehydratase [Anaerolineae bacterium]|nr:GDP-mannose 4,6-dehydratase [Anaerolineae bacterium]
MTTLITGGAGFIGSRLGLRLLDQGESVIILDNFDPYYDPALKRANVAAMGEKAIVVEGSVCDEPLVAALFEQYPIDRVAHLGALANVRYSVERGRQYADVNTSGTVTLLDAARKHQVKVFVIGSTSSVYGQTARIPFVEEDAATLPLAPYPASKRAAEMFGYSYHQLFGLNVNVVRFFNVYGPHGRPDMMPMKAIQAILRGETIQLFEGGELQRDWTYIDDIVAGVCLALDKPLGYEIFNLGFGAPITLNAFIRIYERLIGKQAMTVNVPTPRSEPPITYCDNSKARNLLGFAPKVDIETGLTRTWEWYCERYGVSVNPAGADY